MRKKLHLSEAIDLYIKGLHSAPATVKARRSRLGLFAGTLRGDVLIHNIKTEHIEGFLNRYENPNSYNQVLSTMRGFLDWHLKRGNLTRNVALIIDRRKAPVEGAMSKQRIPQEDWQRLLEVADSIHPVYRASVAVGLYTGLRGSDWSTLKVRDLHRGDDGVIEEIRAWNKKGKRAHMVPVFQELAEELERWLAWYGQRYGDDFGNLDPSYTLLPPRSNAPAFDEEGNFIPHSRDTAVCPTRVAATATRIVKTVLDKAGYITKGEGGHTLRRSIAVAMYKEDVARGYSEAIMNVKTLLDHSDVSTTQTYLGADIGKERLRERVARRRAFRTDKVAADNVVPFRKEA